MIGSVNTRAYETVASAIHDILKTGGWLFP